MGTTVPEGTALGLMFRFMAAYRKKMLELRDAPPLSWCGEIDGASELVAIRADSNEIIERLEARVAADGKQMRELQEQHTEALDALCAAELALADALKRAREDEEERDAAEDELHAVSEILQGSKMGIVQHAAKRMKNRAEEAEARVKELIGT